MTRFYFANPRRCASPFGQSQLKTPGPPHSHNAHKGCQFICYQSLPPCQASCRGRMSTNDDVTNLADQSRP
ncbi:hypothetical protein Pcinc_036022 [Petrolisthes cinctipes]|uniref:Uncharacterized protein n=1 Tax=Petrolisthes cinctipes TaxID=88211 RepID=A0AAE1BVB5_PETCI|nr:hypothetical protein Pcinc_036022 [Petrolisthes cinctipes]